MENTKENYKLKGVTTTDFECGWCSTMGSTAHKHTYEVNEVGNGKTNKVDVVPARHFHSIKEFIIYKKDRYDYEGHIIKNMVISENGRYEHDGHSHTLEKME